MTSQVPVDLGGNSYNVGAVASNHVLLDGDDIICDLGRLIKRVTLPFPTTKTSSRI